MVCMLSREGMEGDEAKANAGNLGAAGTDKIHMNREAVGWRHPSHFY